jgi:uncharacterized ion transporter superfamily protein YfcC
MILKKFPHVYVLLFLIILISALLTYILPANKYEFAKKPDGTVSKLIDPKSYHPVDPSPVDLWGVLQAVPAGFIQAASIIFFIFFVVGSFSVVTATGAVEAGIKATTLALRGREALLIFVVVALFAVGGSTFGMAEEALVFIPMLVLLAMGLGYDSLTGVALALAGPCAGFTAAFMNPFTLGVAQGIVGLPMFSGMEYRIVLWLASTATVAYFIYRYAKKVKKNPEISDMYEEDKQREVMDVETKVDFTLRHKLVLIIVLLTFILLIYGVNAWGWYIDELGALFIGMAIVCGFVGGLWPSKLATVFIDGATSVTIGALVVGLARAIIVVLNNGNILHTIVNFLASLVASLPAFLSVIGMYIVQILISIVIPSGSGMANVTMPIMGPLGTLLGISQQTVVLVYQYADGFTNIIIPTSGYLLAGLAMAKVPYEKWVKWYWPLFLILLVEGAVAVIIAQIINFGPF